MKTKMTFSKTLQSLFYIVFTGLLLSGVIWLLLDLKNNDTYLDAKINLMMLHGALAMAALILIGWIIPTHIKIGWKAKKNLRTGVLMITLTSLLILSGYVLYYAGNETLRQAAIWLHNGVGLAFPLVLLWHIISGRQAR